MKILFVVPYVPNLIRVRPFNLVKSLTKLGHEVTVLTLYVNDKDKMHIGELERYCHEVLALRMPLWKSLWNSFLALFTSYPLQSVYSWNPALVEMVDDVNRFDVIHVEHLRGSRYGLYFKQNSMVPVVWDSVDCISHLFEQAVKQSKSVFGSFITRIDLNRTRKYEGWLISQFDKVLVTSEVDKQALLALSEKIQDNDSITVLPNGVNLDYFKPNPEIDREEATLVVTGKMSYHANVTMVLNLVHKIMPRIWADRSDVKLYIVGKDPSQEIKDAGQLEKVVVTGTVDDMRPYLYRATVAVAPVVYGAGIQNKVLEAMACGVPVLTTSQSAGSILAEPDKDFCVADGPEAFAEKTLRLIKDREYADRIGSAGYSFMKKNHDWMLISDRLEEVYDGVIGN